MTMRGLAVALGTALLICGAARAHAEESSVVVLVRPPPRGGVVSGIVKETILRLSAELQAAGFAVRLVDGKPGEDGRTQVEGAAGRVPGEEGEPDDPPFATIAVLEMEKERGAVTDIWIADHVTEKTLVRRVEVGKSGHSSAASDLAVRSVELLRASLLELSAVQKRALSSDLARWLDLEQPPAAPVGPPAAPVGPPAAPVGPPAAPVVGPAAARPAPAAAPVARAERALPASAATTMLSAGFGVLSNGLGVAPGPLFRAGFTPRLGITVRVLLAPGIVDTVLHAAAGDVKIRQTAAALDVAHTFFERAWIHPMLALGVGLEQLRVDGAAKAPYYNEHHTVFTMGLTAGAGLGVRITPSLEAVAEIDALAHTPEPVVTVLHAAAGHAGLVTGLFSIGLSATF